MPGGGDQDRRFIGKRSHWQAHVSVAATGTRWAPYQRSDPFGIHPKAFADLEFTSADTAYWEDWWREGDWAMRPNHEWHVARHDVDYAAVIESLNQAACWFSDASEDSEFDGGSLTFCYSGHGREGDGALCLNSDTTLSPHDFVDACLEIKRASPSPGRLRVSVILDSCYSGAFLLTVLDRILRAHPDELSADYLSAASMPDEVAFEVPVLKHGLATYCQSVRMVAPGSLTAVTQGGVPAWAIASGPAGCSFVTAGGQNPVTYDNYELTGAHSTVTVWDGEPHQDRLRSRDEWERDLLLARDELVSRFAGIRMPGFGTSARLTESEVAAAGDARRLVYDADYRRAQGREEPQTAPELP